MTHIVMSASAHMPNSVKAPYKRVAVVELEPGFSGRPAMISERARGVRRIVQTWERCHARGVNTAYARAKHEAQAECDRLNGGRS